MTAKLNRRLYLVIPIEQEGKTVYAHCSPVSTEQFANSYLLMAKAFAKLYKEDLGVLAGPRVAAMLLKEVAASLGKEEEGVRLLQDLRRLINVIGPTENGWVPLPFEDALKSGAIDREDAEEVENASAFFTLAWRMHKRSEREEVLTGAAAIWSAQLTSLACTEYLASLPTSTTAAGST